ncbi:MAG: cysteine hydrolase family protein [Polyangiaceae bacterium]
MSTTPLAIDPRTSALLVMDYQTSIVDGLAADRDALLARTASLLGAARAAGMRVVYVVIGFRDGYPEVSASNPIFGAIRGTGRFVDGSPGSEVHSAVAPAAGDVVVTKRRVSGFAGCDLEMVLRAGGITTLVLAGIATSGVVLSTVRQAADLDFAMVIVEDCCADRDAEVHRVLMEKVLARQATVAKAEAAVAALTR